jgi:hypothetical protein
MSAAATPMAVRCRRQHVGIFPISYGSNRMQCRGDFFMRVGAINGHPRYSIRIRTRQSFSYVNRLKKIRDRLRADSPGFRFCFAQKPGGLLDRRHGKPHRLNRKTPRPTTPAGPPQVTRLS